MVQSNPDLVGKRGWAELGWAGRSWAALGTGEINQSGERSQ